MSMRTFPSWAPRRGLKSRPSWMRQRGVRQALQDRYARFRESLPLRIPFVRERFKEMLCLPDSEQFLKWQTGKLVYQLVMLRRRTPPYGA